MGRQRAYLVRIVCLVALMTCAPALPAWLTLQDHGTATLSGTPTDIGEYEVVLRVTDRAGALAEQVFTMTVERPRCCVFLPLVLRSAHDGLQNLREVRAGERTALAHPRPFPPGGLLS